MDCAWSKDDAQYYRHLVSLAQRECVNHRWAHIGDGKYECCHCGVVKSS